MLVRDYMTPDPVTITPQNNIADAFALLRENKIRRLPVVDKGKLVGIMTDRDLREVSPSPATSLSIFEINYLLSKMTIDKVIKKQKLITIKPDAYLEEAALLMREHNIGALPVVENDKLVGIITESNIFDAFIEIMGLHEPGTRLNLKVEDKPGTLAKIMDTIFKHGGDVSHLAVFHGGVLVVQLRNEEAGKIVDDLVKQGLTVKSVSWRGRESN
ncbi:MAG: CBS and ACT domain-containing protein [Thermacetogeniaceae bacterium]